MSRKGKFIVAKLVMVVLVAALIVSVGCTSTPSPTPTQTPTTSPTTQPTTSPTSTPTSTPTTPTGSPTPVQKPITLVHNSYMLETSASGRMEAEFMDQVTKATNGAVQFQRNWGGALSKAPDQIPMTGKGAIDMADLTILYRYDLFPLGSGFELIYMTPYPEVQTWAAWEMYHSFPALREEFEKKNNVRLIFFTTPVETAVGTSKEIKSINDYKGLRLRSIGSTTPFVQAIGSVPTAVAQADMFEAVQKGVIAGTASNAIDYVVDYGYHEILKYVTDPGVGLIFFTFTVMNLDKWNSLTPQTQATIEKLSEEYWKKRALDFTDELILKAVKTYVTAGGKYYDLPASDWDNIKNQIVPKLWNDWAKDLDSKGLPGSQFLSTYQTLLKKYAPQARTLLLKQAFEKVAASK